MEVGSRCSKVVLVVVANIESILMNGSMKIFQDGFMIDSLIESFKGKKVFIIFVFAKSKYTTKHTHTGS